MQLTFRCPRCHETVRIAVSEHGDSVNCAFCDWTRSLVDSDLADDQPRRCLACGCDDLWRQKDFPQRLGLLLVGLGIVFSTIAWGYTRPVLAISILMAFALLDLLLYNFMQDVLVCYQCGARHGQTTLDDHSGFNLEVAERYRQESMRKKDSTVRGS